MPTLATGNPVNSNKEKSSRERDGHACRRSIYAEGVRFISPGARSAPWESDPKITLRRRRYTKTRDKPDAWIVPCCITPSAYRSHFVCTQGALRDPGLWNITPSAYPRIESMSSKGSNKNDKLTTANVCPC